MKDAAITANDGLEAINIFKETPDVAFVILDLTMPRMDCEQCFRELRSLNPLVKVIMSSGYNEQEVSTVKGQISYPASVSPSAKASRDGRAS
jgi:CheY-like chemotaxis protein